MGRRISSVTISIRIQRARAFKLFAQFSVVCVYMSVYMCLSCWSLQLWNPYDLDLYLCEVWALRWFCKRSSYLGSSIPSPVITVLFPVIQYGFTVLAGFSSFPVTSQLGFRLCDLSWITYGFSKAYEFSRLVCSMGLWWFLCQWLA